MADPALPLLADPMAAALADDKLYRLFTFPLLAWRVTSPGRGDRI
ncbi:MAG: hypothetical protein ABR588_05200 [Sphingomicrobium sp.]